VALIRITLARSDLLANTARGCASLTPSRSTEESAASRMREAILGPVPLSAPASVESARPHEPRLPFASGSGGTLNSPWMSRGAVSKDVCRCPGSASTSISSLDAPRSVPNFTAEGLTRFPRSRAKAAVLVIVQVGKRIGTDTPNGRHPELLG
jgi:hypothetical protein